MSCAGAVRQTPPVTDAPADAPLCSLRTREAEEDPAGTASEARAWVVAFRAGPWGAPALGDVPDLAEVADGLDGVRVVLAEPPAAGRRGRGATAPVAVLAGTLPGATWRRDLTGTWLDLVRHLHQPVVRDALAAGRDPGIGAPSDRAAFVVCHHAAKDACCGRFGGPAADAVLASLPVRRRVFRKATPVADVYRSSHLGGHRFAPTAVALPWGLMFGGLGPDPQNLAFALGGVLGDRPILEGYRGRTSSAPPAQAAEIAVRQRVIAEGLPAGPEDVVADSPEELPGDTTGETAGEDRRWRVAVRHSSGRSFVVTVGRQPTGRTRPMSCGGADVAVEEWVTEVAPASPVR